MKRQIADLPEVFGICLQHSCLIVTPDGVEMHSVPLTVDRKAFLKELIDNRERLLNEKKFSFRIKRFIRVSIFQVASYLINQTRNVLRRWFGGKPALKNAAIDCQISKSCDEQTSIDFVHNEFPLTVSDQQLPSESKRRGKAGVA
ncbi:hypothetical protein F9L00_24930 [Brucella anthropi]|uniref:hypothetical protein n=1 Tax=Brucella anthropi TaxID=529 RepID=UPI00124F7486|nr:hypothetical protein [Brucella anthropi]KAB2772911.1 hypothetical protein F9L00_24930 [Brucella anthropi]